MLLESGKDREKQSVGLLANGWLEVVVVGLFWLLLRGCCLCSIANWFLVEYLIKGTAISMYDEGLD